MEETRALLATLYRLFPAHECQVTTTRRSGRGLNVRHMNTSQTHHTVHYFAWYSVALYMCLYFWLRWFESVVTLLHCGRPTNTETPSNTVTSVINRTPGREERNLWFEFHIMVYMFPQTVLAVYRNDIKFVKSDSSSDLKIKRM
jgi:hypothetical protein